MRPQLFTNCQIFDGNGAPPYPGDVLVSGNRITAVRRPGEAAVDRPHADVVDCRGGTLMPGMVEAHSHITFTDVMSLKELALIPPEEHLLKTYQNAKLMLDSGFTSLYSAASAKIRTEVVLRNAINAGTLPGPRMRAASPEMVSTGGLADDSQLHLPLQTAGLVADGVDEVRRAARMLIREGVDTIKVDLSGGNSVRPGFARKMAYTEPEIAAIAEEAHTRGVWLSCHAQADESVRMALKYKFRMIYHLNYVVDETIDLLVAARDSIYVAPAIGIVYVMVHEGEQWGFTPQVIAAGDFEYMLENCAKAFGVLKDEGVRILPGGDYGFAWNPIGTNARDLEHFVNIIGFTPAQALMSATKWGGELMDIPDLGLIADGYLADLLVLAGDPVQDIRLLQDRANLKVIMKDGTYYKNELQPA